MRNSSDLKIIYFERGNGEHEKGVFSNEFVEIISTVIISINIPLIIIVHQAGNKYGLQN